MQEAAVCRLACRFAHIAGKTYPQAATQPQKHKETVEMNFGVDERINIMDAMRSMNESSIADIDDEIFAQLEKCKDTEEVVVTTKMKLALSGKRVHVSAQSDSLRKESIKSTTHDVVVDPNQQRFDFDNAKGEDDD